MKKFVLIEIECSERICKASGKPPCRYFRHSPSFPQPYCSLFGTSLWKGATKNTGRCPECRDAETKVVDIT